MPPALQTLVKEMTSYFFIFILCIVAYSEKKTRLRYILKMPKLKVFTKGGERRDRKTTSEHRDLK